MGNTVLENCGVHTDRLIGIANMVKKQKITNGEPINNQTIWDIDNDIYEAYQTILSDLSGLKDGGSIEKAINYLETEIQHSGTTHGLKEVASAITEKVIIEDRNIFLNNEENAEKKAAENIVNVEKVADINDAIEKSNQVLDNVFDDELIQSIDKLLEKAQEGDIDSYAEIKVIEDATRFMGKNLTLEGKNAITLALGRMRRLLEINTPSTQKVLRKMAEQFRGQLDVFELDEDGREIVSPTKIEELAKEKIPEQIYKNMNPKETNTRLAKAAMSRKKYEGKTAEDIKTNNKKKGKKQQINDLINKYSKLEDEEAVKKMEELFEKDPESFEEIVKEQIEWYNSFQKMGKTNQAQINQRKAMLMSSAIQSVKQRNLTQPNQADVSNQSRDDEPSL